MSHEDPVVMEGSGCPASMEDSRILTKNSLKLLQMAGVSLYQESMREKAFIHPLTLPPSLPHLSLNQREKTL